MHLVYSALVLLCFAAVAALGPWTGWATLLALAPLPLGIYEIIVLPRRRNEELNLSLAGTAILGGSTGLLLAIGLVL